MPERPICGVAVLTRRRRSCLFPPRSLALVADPVVDGIGWRWLRLERLKFALTSACVAAWLLLSPLDWCSSVGGDYLRNSYFCFFIRINWPGCVRVVD